MRNVSMLLLTACFFVFTFSGCVGPRVEVPTAHVGKVMHSGGLDDDLRGTSSFRLPWNPLGLNPAVLVTVEASDRQKSETLSIFMPKDQLILELDVRGTYSISKEKDRVNPIFSRRTAKMVSGHVRNISFDDVYETYAEQLVLTYTRNVLTKYSIDYVLSHREEVNKELENVLHKALSKTPIIIDHFGMSSLQPPELIVVAQKLARERVIEIERAKADRLVRLTEADARLAVARKQQMVDLLQADTQRQVGFMLSKGVNLPFIQQRSLSILDEISGQEKKIFIVPTEALQNPSIAMPINQSVMGSR
ncbi:MAG TPA: SPFH domain-containing protein [Oligoflexia bacterium]|nr:SPFH domain-containing protein [Oligoflexia bacterium]HMP49669.1 SPFH domain-containing protein [Oligoflexia bacterium]